MEKKAQKASLDKKPLVFLRRDRLKKIWAGLALKKMGQTAADFLQRTAFGPSSYY